jgi:predicted porin
LDRLLWVTSYAYLDDTGASKNSRQNSNRTMLFTTNLAYNFTESGKTSISVEYQNGTDRNTLENLNQYLVTLGVKY